MVRAARSLWFFLAVCLGGSPALGARTDAESAVVISRARAAIGREALLDSIDSMRFVGRLESFTDNSVRQIEVLLLKPGLVLTTAESKERTVVVGIDAYEGWQKVVEEGRARTIPIGIENFWEARFGAIDNLYFFRAADHVYGSVEYVGSEYFEGRETDVLIFAFNEANRYRRRFDKETGRMVSSERLGSPVSTKELSVETFDELALPTVIENFTDGKRVSRLVWTEIEVNPQVDPAVFSYPAD